MSLRSIKDFRISKGFDPDIFSGYEDGHLWNSIAHAHIKYDESIGKMEFLDYYKGREIYNNKLSLDEFKEKLNQINVFSEISLHMI